MSILAANLKHLYQWRLAWLWYVLVLCQAPVILMPPFSTKLDRYLGYLIASLLMGVLAGGLQKDVLIKPFSFCLPGHRHIVRPFIFWIGGTVNLILGCVFLWYPGLGFSYVLLVVLAGGLLGMIVYFYGVYIGFANLPSLAGGIFPLFVFGAIFFKWDKIIQGIIIHQPIVMILVFALVCIWVWRLLGRDFLARKYCGKLVVGMFDNLNMKRAQKYRQAQVDQNSGKIRARFFESAQEFFLGKMERYDFLSRGRYIWGNIYMAIGKCFGYWQMKDIWGFLALIIFLVLFFGFVGPSGSDKRVVNITFVFPVFAMLGLDILPYRSMLFPAGRTEKYFGSLVLAIAVTLLVGLLTLAVTGISVFLETTLPEFSFRETMFNYHGMEINRFYIYLLFMPVVLSLVVISPRKKISLVIAVMALVYGWLIFEIGYHRTLTDMIGPMGVAGLVALCWAGFLVVLRYVCMRRSLVGQSG